MRMIVRWAAATVAVELISLLTIFTSWQNTVAVVCVGIAVFVLTVTRPTIAMGVVLLELLIGSKGYLLQFCGWPSSLSLRIVITGAFCAGWAFHFWKHGTWRELRALFVSRWLYAALFALIVHGFLRGVVVGNEKLLQDANAWADWILLVPVLDLSWRYRARIRADLVPVLWVGIFWLAAKTLLLEYVFSHGFVLISQPLYLWVRRTGVGEVTLVTANAFRIFMQSYIYVAGAWLVAAGWVFVREPGTVRRFWRSPAWWMLAASSMILGLSLSRSIWIGLAAGGLVLIGLAWRYGHMTLKKAAHASLSVVSASAAGLLAIVAVLAVPLPPVEIALLGELFGSRASLSEAAAVSRWNLLPVLWSKIQEAPIIGSGFGATVTYETRDPRILAERADGMYTTYAFEWGWLEFWIKFGALGIPLMFALLISLAWRLWRTPDPLWLRIGAVSAIVAVSVIHVFTPYLNHPLGFLFFFLGEGMILSAYATSRDVNSDA